MTGLTQTAVVARRVIRYGIYFIVFLTVGRILLTLTVNVYRKIFPPPLPEPTVKYGRLPKLNFPEKQKVNLTYSLETSTGEFPKITPQAKVFFMPKISANLLSLDVAKQEARSLGFISEPNQLSETTYSFGNPNYPVTMEINIVTGTFSVSYDLNSDRTPLDKKPPAGEIAAALVRSYLSAANILPDDLTGEMLPNFLKLDSGKFVNALAQSEADVVKINLFRKDYDELPSRTANPLEANVWFIVGGSQDRNQQIIAGEYHYYKVDETQFSTYPIISPEDAYSNLTSGNAYIANQGLAKEGEGVTIRKIYLAYYDSENPNEFYEPIYVFEGDKGFMAYYPAITSDYYGN
jgi:hypothetical protein